MNKNSQLTLEKSARTHGRIALFKTIPMLTLCGFFVAISVLGKIFRWELTPTMRISFETMPVIMAGYLFNPIIGLCVGVASDLIGCFVTGMSPNWLLTVGAGTVGLTAGLFGLFWKKGYRTGWKKYAFDLRLIVSIAVSRLIGSVIINSLAFIFLFQSKGTDTFAGAMTMIGWRGLQSLILGSAEYILINSLLNNRSVRNYLNVITPWKRRV